MSDDKTLTDGEIHSVSTEATATSRSARKLIATAIQSAAGSDTVSLAKQDAMEILSALKKQDAKGDTADGDADADGNDGMKDAPDNDAA